MYHSFLIHSSADGHLGCFHVLAIANSAADHSSIVSNSQANRNDPDAPQVTCDSTKCDPPIGWHSAEHWVQLLMEVMR